MRTMRTSTILLLSICLSSFATGCGKKEDKKADDKQAEGEKKTEEKKAEGGEVEAKAEAGEGEAKPEEGAAGEVALPKAGLKADAPGGSTVSEMMGNDMVQGPNLVATVEKGDDKPKTGEEATKEADMYSPKDPKVETLEDGYILTFTNEGGAGTNYWVQARREIDGSAWWCSTTASSQEQMDAAVAFCKSLRFSPRRARARAGGPSSGSRRRTRRRL
jgi:hypothetical protein